MANVTTSERLWTLDTTGVIAAVGVDTIIRKIVFIPTTIDHNVVIQEYGCR